MEFKEQVSFHLVKPINSEKFSGEKNLEITENLWQNSLELRNSSVKRHTWMTEWCEEGVRHTDSECHDLLVFRGWHLLLQKANAKWNKASVPWSYHDVNIGLGSLEVDYSNGCCRIVHSSYTGKEIRKKTVTEEAGKRLTLSRYGILMWGLNQLRKLVALQKNPNLRQLVSISYCHPVMGYPLWESQYSADATMPRETQVASRNK